MAWQCTFPPTIVPPSCQRSSLYRRLDPIPPPSLNFVSFTETLTKDDRFGNGDVVVVRYGGRQRRSAFVRGFSTVVSLLFQADRELLRRGYKPEAVFFGDFKEA
ncbi:hypothetical protein SSX86_001447 [Deinandra increscens subsp. villosa]|uniref:Uncharacterized protein n=1 Tax=Deinandra increscens subsp. villosa TaxID=3103831 RepID=A0AAP0DRM9_9ASTR